MTRTEGTRRQTAVICAIDIGGSGCRIRLGSAQPATGAGTARSRSLGPDLRLPQGITSGPQGLNIRELLTDIRAMLRTRFGNQATSIHTVCLGCAGIASLCANPERLCADTALILGARHAMLVPDSVAAHAGALSGRPGVVVAAGTGVIALGTDYRRIWRRSDGWGYLLGDRGSGSWIGRHALHIALNTYEDRPGEQSRALLHAALGHFGEPDTWPGKIYPHADRARILASFVPLVTACADEDSTARKLLRRAGTEIAATACTAWVAGLPLRISYAGGILTRCAPIRTAFIAAVRARHRDARITEPEGTPLDGAALLAANQALASAESPALSLGKDSWAWSAIQQDL